MSRFVAENNQLGFFYESGTYANITGNLYWIGQVQSHEPEESQNVMQIRYLGAGTRDVNQFIGGPIDIEGAFTFYPVDFKFLFYALGSCVDGWAGSAPTIPNRQHFIRAMNNTDVNAWISGPIGNPFMSFSLEDAWTIAGGATDGVNKVTTYRGNMVDEYALSTAEGEPVECEISYIGQYFTSASGVAATSIIGSGLSNQTGLRPLIWSDTQVHVPSGTVIDEVKEWEFTVNNNLQIYHPTNGSRVIYVPQPLNREYEVTLTMNAESQRFRTFYDTYFQGGSIFNMMLFFNKSGTAAAIGFLNGGIVMSGCRVTEMSIPSEVESVNETEITIIPQVVTGSFTDLFSFYNAA